MTAYHLVKYPSAIKSKAFRLAIVQPFLNICQEILYDSSSKYSTNELLRDQEKSFRQRLIIPHGEATLRKP